MLHDLLAVIKSKFTEHANHPEQGRYERKFVVKGLNYKQIKSIILHHPAIFREIHRQRQINNIYLDTFDFKTYFDNVYGNTTRVKVRIRWYGSTFGSVEEPVLELKIKNGLAGRKESYPLIPFTLDNSFNQDKLDRVLKQSDLPLRVKEKLSSYVPSLLNSYKRQYFQSDDKHIRVTIDDAMTYYKITSRNNTFTQKKLDRESVIVEMKYSLESAGVASDITQHLPMRMTKSSKYVNGIDEFHPHLAT